MWTREIYYLSVLEAWAQADHNPFRLRSYWSLLSEFGDGGLLIMKKEGKSKNSVFGFDAVIWGLHVRLGLWRKISLIPFDSMHRHEPDFQICVFPTFLSVRVASPDLATTGACEPSWTAELLSGSLNIRNILSWRTWLSPDMYSRVNHSTPCQ